MRCLGSSYLGAQAEIGNCFSGNRSGRPPDWCTKFFLPASPSVFQCLLNAANHRLAHALGIAKTDLALCRVHIYIHSAGIELNKKKRNWVLPFHESSVVAFADGPGDKTAFNRPAVHEHELLAAGLSAETCLTDKTTDSNFGRGSAVHFDQALQQFDAV